MTKSGDRSAAEILRRKHREEHPNCTYGDKLHYVPPSFGQVGFYLCDPPEDLTNHSRVDIRRCTCDPVEQGDTVHHPYCETNHPHHPCDERSCRFATPGTATYGEIYSMLDLMRDGSVSQDAMATMLHRRLVPPPPAGSPALKESAESFNSAAGNASQREQAERDAEVDHLTDERNLALWLHAEAVWKREEAHRHWRNMQAHIGWRIAKPGEPIVVAADRLAAELAALRAEVERLRAEAIQRGEQALRDAILDRMGFREDAVETADGSANDDLAYERADAVMEFIDLASTHMLPRKLLPRLNPLGGEEARGTRADSLTYIRDLYRVPAEVNGRVIFDGDPGKITGALGPYLLVLLDGDDEPVPVHPTWHMSYVTTEVTDEASPSGEGTAK